ncbi:hypothetical protein C8R43DRAFT_1141623 [Mycena crocata]|nr:hypothetical protein C8R43DRAFT_1141623 [Mycena crocata]
MSSQAMLPRYLITPAGGVRPTTVHSRGGPRPYRGIFPRHQSLLSQFWPNNAQFRGEAVGETKHLSLWRLQQLIRFGEPARLPTLPADTRPLPFPTPTTEEEHRANAKQIIEHIAMQLGALRVVWNDNEWAEINAATEDDILADRFDEYTVLWRATLGPHALALADTVHVIFSPAGRFLKIVGDPPAVAAFNAAVATDTDDADDLASYTERYSGDDSLNDGLSEYTTLPTSVHTHSSMPDLIPAFDEDHSTALAAAVLEDTGVRVSAWLAEVVPDTLFNPLT